MINEPFIKIDQNWNSYFWNRGIALDPTGIQTILCNQLIIKVLKRTASTELTVLLT